LTSHRDFVEGLRVWWRS